MESLSADERALLQRVHALWLRARRARWLLVVCTAAAQGGLCASLGLAMGLASNFVGVLAVLGLIVGAAWAATRPKAVALDCAHLLERALSTQGSGARTGIGTAYALVAARQSGPQQTRPAPWLEALAQAANRSCATLAPERLPMFSPHRPLLGLSVSAVGGAMVLALVAPARDLGRMQTPSAGRATAQRNAATAVAPEAAQLEIARARAALQGAAHGRARAAASNPDKANVNANVTANESALESGSDEVAGTAGRGQEPRSAGHVARELDRLARAHEQLATERGDAPESSETPPPGGTESARAHTGERALQRLSREAQAARPALSGARAGAPPIAGAQGESGQHAQQRFEEAARGAPTPSASGTRSSERPASDERPGERAGESDTSAQGAPGEIGGASRAGANGPAKTGQPMAQRRAGDLPAFGLGADQGPSDAAGGAALGRKARRGPDSDGHRAEIDLGVGSGPGRAQIIETSASEGFSSPGYAHTFSAYTAVIEHTLVRDVVPPARREVVRRYFRLIRPRTH